MSHIQTYHDWEEVDLVLVLSTDSTRAELYLLEYIRGEKAQQIVVIADSSRRLNNQYKITSVPFAVIVDEDGRIGAQGTVITLAEIGHLIGRANMQRNQRQQAADVPLIRLADPTHAVTANR